MVPLAFAALLAAAVPEARVETSVFAPEAPAPIVYSYPTLTAVAAGVNAADGIELLWVPVGVQVPLRPDLAVDLEVAVAFMKLTPFAREGWAFTATAGPTWFPLSGDRALTGFFIGPRLQFMIGQAATFLVALPAGGAPLEVGRTIHRSFLVGFDVGWQFRVGRVVFGPVLGASAGFTWGSGSVWATPFEVDSGASSHDTDTFAFGINFNLFKLGVAF